MKDVTPDVVPVSLQGLRPARARIDLDRLTANYHALAAFVPVPVMPVVKADAYGHGAVQVARRLQREGVSMLAVAYAEEGVALRTAGITVPIIVLTGVVPAQAPVLAQHRLTAVVSSVETWNGTLQAALHADAPLPVHVKVDTGMSRLGFSPATFADSAARLQDPGRIVVEGAMTHLACADEDEAATRRQLDLFDDALEALEKRGIRPRYIHACNSAGLAFFRSTHTLVRPGLLIYGVPPRPLGPAVKVQGVMQVSAEVALVKDVAPGTPVSYGARWVAQRASRIATIPLGYADGVPRTRQMAEQGAFALGGQRVPVAGTVCMDLTMADVTERPDTREGEEAVLLGDPPAPDAWELADRAGTNAWQVLVGIGPRVPRVYVEGGRVVAVESRYL
jgi:alanine racemase